MNIAQAMAWKVCDNSWSSIANLSPFCDQRHHVTQYNNTQNNAIQYSNSKI
jgi:hypothetical protein